jgi:uncharacterized protein YbjT (DUF2867 family)
VGPAGDRVPVTVALVGGAGKTGRAVAAALRAQGADTALRPLVRRPAGLAGERVVDLDDASSLRAALAGVDVVHHLAPNVHPDELGLARRVIAAAVAQGVARVVFHSVLKPGIAQMPHHWAKLRAEELLWESGLAVTVLQPGVYAQNLLAALRGDELVVPYDVDAPFSLVDLRDVAAATAVVLLDPAHAGATYELAGPGPVSVREVAAAIGRTARRQPPEEWAAGARSLPAYSRDALLAMFRWYDAHGLVGTPHVLRWLLGREPTVAADVLAGGGFRGPADRPELRPQV